MPRIARLFTGFALGLISLTATAAPAAPAQPPAASTTPAPGAPTAGRFVESCQCSAGAALAPTRTLVFNCECGAMKCVVVTADSGKDAAAPALTCR